MMRACLFLLLLASLPAWAQDGIHRCIGADGNPLFTDQPCAAFQATPVAKPADTAAPASPTVPSPSEPEPVLCATSVAELRESVLGAFARRDPNRLAGLMLWSGYGRDSVVADIRSLGGLMQKPLLDVGPGEEDSAPGDDPADASPTTPASAARQLVVRTAADDGTGVPRETRFDVVKRAGCLWLRGRG